MAARGKLHRARGPIFGTRSRIRGFLRETGRIIVTPRYRGSRWLSAVAVLLLLVLLVTGVLLSLYYYPEPRTAHASVRAVLSEVPAGWLVRGLHHWAGELLLVTVVLHMVSVVLRRAYTRPREPEWCVGMLLLLAVLSFRFTGRLLPWDTLGHASTVQGLGLIRSVPLFGRLMEAWLLAGDQFGPHTLSRFFITHVLLLPWVTAALLGALALLLARHGLKPEDKA
jgi:ubiquinol-cytochrome c reductase cytochrome b subunit